jgi:hypothetical protein
MAGTAAAVGAHGAPVLRGCGLGGCRRVGLAAAAQRREERAVGRLRRVREAPLERVHEDRRPALPHWEAVAPEAQRQPEADGRREQRVRPLARQVGRQARDAEADRVERTLEGRPARGDHAQERFRVGDGRRAGQHAQRGQLGAERMQHACAHEVGQQAVQPPAARAGDTLDRGRVVRIVA